MREFKNLKIAVAGTGYVGLSIATLLSQHHKVTAVDLSLIHIYAVLVGLDKNKSCRTKKYEKASVQ